jgi:osmotically-inducible protein OsmY
MTRDHKLQTAVQAELGWEPSVAAAHIGVTANAGVITLTGHVETYAQKHAAERAAERVKGVLAVAGELVVRLAPGSDRTDGEIAATAIERFAWDVSIPKDAVMVTVEGGWITLTGQLDWWYQRNAAEQAISGLLGVTGVSNQVTIRHKVDTANLSDDIMQALHRSWFLDPRMIRVMAENGMVRLSGTVHTPHDREVAAATAWAAPGVVAVQNDISVI